MNTFNLIQWQEAYARRLLAMPAFCALLAHGPTEGKKSRTKRFRRYTRIAAAKQLQARGYTHSQAWSAVCDAEDVARLWFHAEPERAALD